MEQQAIQLSAAQQLELKRKVDRGLEIKEMVTTLQDMGDKQMAMDVYLLCQKKFKGAGGAIKFMEPYQAASYSRFARSQGLDPFGNGCFYDLENDKPGLTAEGKKQKCHDGGYNFGPPKFEYSNRPWPKSKPKIMGFDEDLGCTCEMEIVGFKTPARYTAWLSEWFMSANPNWKTRTEHMLQVRSQEKAMSMSSGVGVSEQISDQQLSNDLASVEEVVTEDNFKVKEIQ
jgi:hypothetical protein